MRTKIRCRRYILLLACLFAICGAGNQLSEPEPFSEPLPAAAMTVHYLDVGQGNATLIESDGHYMLIDGGGRSHSSFIVSYLKQHGVARLDYIVISHFDADHLSGIIGALHVFDTDTVLAPDYEADTKIYASWKKVMEEKELTAVIPAPGDTYALGNAEFTVVAPVRYDYSDENNNSVGIRLVHGQNRFLFLGDAEIESEYDICETGLDLRSDVYLVSHHGSASSTSEQLLRTVQPSAAVISCGRDNSYGHPHQQTLDRLAAYGITVRRTDLMGTITARSDGISIQWHAEK